MRDMVWVKILAISSWIIWEVKGAKESEPKKNCSKKWQEWVQLGKTFLHCDSVQILLVADVSEVWQQFAHQKCLCGMAWQGEFALMVISDSF